MYNVFIVEDEPLIRDSLRNHLLKLKQTLPIAYCGEAGDGELALAEIIDLKPDIILTDIQMPFMDGLAFAKEARRLFPKIRIIFISGFDEFEYAKVALQVQADDYLLKPIRANDLAQALEKVIQTLDEQKQAKNDQLPSSDMLLELKKNHLLNGLFKGKLSMSEAIHKMSELNHPFIGKKMTVLLAQSQYNQDFEDYAHFSTELHALFKGDARILYSSVSSRFIKFLILADDKQEVLATAYQSAQILTREFQQEETGIMTVSIGSVVDRISEIPNSFQIAQTQLYSFNQSPDQKIISYEDTNKDSGLLPDFSFEKELHIALSQLTDESHMTLIQRLLVEQDTAEETMMFRFFILVELKNIAQKKDAFPTELLQKINNMNQLVQIASNDSTYQQILNEMTRVFIDVQIPSNLAKHHHVITQATQYINEHYTNPDLSLNLVAEEVALSPSHFSTIFSQSKDHTFIEYLTDKRIQLAKQLLRETNLRLAEITLRIGYNDPNYFSFLFKKKQGLSPTEYRQQKKGSSS